MKFVLFGLYIIYDVMYMHRGRAIIIIITMLELVVGPASGPSGMEAYIHFVVKPKLPPLRQAAGNPTKGGELPTLALDCPRAVGAVGAPEELGNPGNASGVKILHCG